MFAHAVIQHNLHAAQTYYPPPTSACPNGITHCIAGPSNAQKWLNLACMSRLGLGHYLMMRS